MNPALRFKAVVGTLIVLIIVYSGLWYTSAFKAQKDLTAMLNNWRDSGLQVEHKAVELSGFPYRFELTVPNLFVATREKGLSLDTKSITLISHLWTPGHWIAEATNTRVGLADGSLAFEEGLMRASYRVHEGNRIVVKIDSAGSQDFRWINDSTLPKPTAWTLLLGRDNSETNERVGLYEKRSLEFKFYAEKDSATVDISGGVSGPDIKDWSTLELANWRDQGGLLAIDSFAWNAGDMSVQMSGDVTLDEQFRLLGSAALQIEEWSMFAELVQTIGLLPLADPPAQTSLTIQNGLIQLGDQTIGRSIPLIK